MQISSQRSLAILRITLCALMITHGIARIHLGIVDKFGSFLHREGFPAGEAIAWALTLLEIFGGAALALGKARRYLATFFALLLAAGIALVHAEEGWFVVGAGRNGMEYSVLMIVGFLLVGYSRSSD